MMIIKPCEDLEAQSYLMRTLERMQLVEYGNRMD